VSIGCCIISANFSEFCKLGGSKMRTRTGRLQSKYRKYATVTQSTRIVINPYLEIVEHVQIEKYTGGPMINVISK
jgi:hypothetical protein